MWSPEKGDGVRFIIEVRSEKREARSETIFSKYIDPKNNPEDRHWHDEIVDLSKYGGEEVILIFVTTCGSKGDCNYDWAGWAEPEIIQ